MEQGGRLRGFERVDSPLCEPPPSVSGQQAGEIRAASKKRCWWLLIPRLLTSRMIRRNVSDRGCEYHRNSLLLSVREMQAVKRIKWSRENYFKK